MTSPAPPRAGAVGAQRIALISAAVAGFLTPFMGSAVNIALPAIGDAFELDAVELGWVTSAFLLSAAVFLLPFGRLADIVGRKRVFIAGLLLFSVATLLCAGAPSGGALIVFRLLQGAGGALIFGTGTAILTSVYPPARLGGALGITVAAVYLGLSLGPFLGGLLTSWFGWQGIFLFTAPLAFIAAALVALRLEGEWAEAKGERFDIVGSVLYGGALVLLMIGLARMPERTGIVLAGAGLVGIGAFIAWEGRARSPLIELRLFRENTVFAYSNLAALINYSATFAVPFLLSLYFQYVRGLAPELTGLVLVVQPAVQTLFSPVAGRLSERIEPRLLASTGMGIIAAGLFVLATIGRATPFGLLLTLLGLLGFGFALFSSPNTNAVMSSVEPRVYGIASGTLGTMRLLGQMLSMALVLLLFAVIMGEARITPERYPLFLRSAKTAFAIFGVLCAGGVYASLQRGELRSSA